MRRFDRKCNRHSSDFRKGKQPDYIKRRQPPEFRRLALFAGNELRFCRSCSGRQENFLRALDTPAPRPGRSTVCLCWYPAVQPTRPGGRGLGRRAHAPIWRPPVVSRPYARQHGSASVPVGGVPLRCESRLAPDKSKYNHGSLLTRRRYLKRRILRRADSAKLHLLRPGTTGLCISPDLKRNKPRGSSAYAKPPGARMNRKGNAGMFPRSFQMTLRNAWLKPCRAPVSS